VKARQRADVVLCLRLKVEQPVNVDDGDGIDASDLLKALSPVHTSNTDEATGNFVACCFDIVAFFGSNVEATCDFVERTKFQCKTLSTFLQFLATKSNVAPKLLLV